MQSSNLLGRAVVHDAKVASPATVVSFGEGATLRELHSAQKLNKVLQEELSAASAEARLAREALNLCASQAEAELAAQEAAASSSAAASEGGTGTAAEEARELAEALLAAELALEAALVANDRRNA